MARDYGKRNTSRQGTSFSKQLLLVFVCFLVGYLSAAVFDIASVSRWINTQLLARQATSAATKAVPQQAVLPKPKFEFYTLLASERPDARVEAIKAAPVATAQATPPANPTAVATGTTSTVSVAVNRNSPVSAPLAIVVSAKPLPAPVVNNKGAYLVQVAAFKSQQEADRMKAALVLKGFVVSISMVSQQNTNWYRVNIGPFASRAQAQQVQGAVARSEHIVGMIRKMDA